MSKTAVLAAASAAMFGALSLVTAPGAEAYKDGYGYRHGYEGSRIYYGSPPYVYSGYRPYYGPYYYPRARYYPEEYYYRGRPAGIFRPAGIVYRPSYAVRSEEYCRGWGWVYSRCGKYRKWRCLAW